MTFVQLRYILTIAETKSMNKAAELLYVSQPSLTNAVKELEKEIGITIFFRSGRGVTLTDDGAEFLLYAKEICMQYEQHMKFQISRLQKLFHGFSIKAAEIQNSYLTSHCSHIMDNLLCSCFPDSKFIL